MHSTARVWGQITTAGLNLNAATSLNDFQLTDVEGVTYTNLASLLTSNNVGYVKDGDLFFNDGSGNQVRITSGGALDVGSVAGIGGDYASTAATVFYTDSTTTYFFQDSAAAAGKIDVGDIACEDVTTAGAVSTGTLAVSTSATIASPTLSGTVAVTGASTISAVATFTAAPVGYGIAPLGSMVAIATGLTGFHAIPSTGTVDSAGWQYCDGAVIPGGQTVSGTTPDLTDSRFIMGSTSSGSTGGATSSAHTHTGPSHTHTIAHTHASGDYTAAVTVSSGGNIITKPTGGSTYSATIASTDNLSGASATSGTFDGTDVYGTSGASSAANSGSAGTGTTSGASATDNRPLFVSAQYLIRVK